MLWGSGIAGLRLARPSVGCEVDAGLRQERRLSMRPGVTSALFAILKLGRPARERHPNQKSKQETSINTARKWLTSENHYDYNRRSRGRHRHHYPDPLAPQTLPAVPAAPAAVSEDSWQYG